MDGITNIIGTAIGWIFFILATFGIALVPFAAWIYLVFSGEKARKAKAESYLKDTLMDGEGLIAFAIEKRPAALMTRRSVLGITSSRIILIRRGYFGGFTMEDNQWKDLVDVQIAELALEEICGTKLEFNFINQSNNFSSHIGSDVARVIYKKAQSEEQAWEEKRRVREMEERRASAGGIFISGQAGSESASTESPDNKGSVLEQIQKAKGMLDDGAISDAEFNEIKAKILSGGF